MRNYTPLPKSWVLLKTVVSANFLQCRHTGFNSAGDNRQTQLQVKQWILQSLLYVSVSFSARSVFKFHPRLAYCQIIWISDFSKVHLLTFPQSLEKSELFHSREIVFLIMLGFVHTSIMASVFAMNSNVDYTNLLKNAGTPDKMWAEPKIPPFKYPLLFHVTLNK